MVLPPPNVGDKAHANFRFGTAKEPSCRYTDAIITADTASIIIAKAAMSPVVDWGKTTKTSEASKRRHGRQIVGEKYHTPTVSGLFTGRVWSGRVQAKEPPAGIDEAITAGTALTIPEKTATNKYEF